MIARRVLMTAIGLYVLSATLAWAGVGVLIALWLVGKI